MDIRLIALDLDGTALNSDGHISEATRAAFEKADRMGISIAIATGRPFKALPEEIYSIPFIRYAITSNGTAIYDLRDGRNLYRSTLSEENLETLLDILLPFGVVLEASVAGLPCSSKEFLQNLEAYGVNERSAGYLRKTRVPIDDIIQYIRDNREVTEAINVIVTDPEKKEEIRFSVKQIPSLYVTSSAPHFLEFATAGTSKESSLSMMASMLGAAREQVIAFGDSDNDLEMIRYAGIGVAMGNAVPALKEAADYVTLTNDEDGVAAALHKFILFPASE